MNRLTDLPQGSLLAIVNTSPDSFSGDGLQPNTEDFLSEALALARKQLDAGAAGLDVGGVSTRPGSQPIAETEELARTVPVVNALRASGYNGLITVDTTNPTVAEAGLAAGADAINCVNGLDCEEIMRICAKHKAGLVLMHNRTNNAGSDYNQATSHFTDVVSEVAQELQASATTARNIGVSDILVDPGIGFGKTLDQNLELIAQSARLCASVTVPVLYGISRKGVVGAVSGRTIPGERDTVSAVLAYLLAQHGAHVIRAHNTHEHKTVWKALKATS